MDESVGKTTGEEVESGVNTGTGAGVIVDVDVDVGGRTSAVVSTGSVEAEELVSIDEVSAGKITLVVDEVATGVGTIFGAGACVAVVRDDVDVDDADEVDVTASSVGDTSLVVVEELVVALSVATLEDDVATTSASDDADVDESEAVPMDGSAEVASVALALALDVRAREARAKSSIATTDEEEVKVVATLLITCALACGSAEADDDDDVAVDVVGSAGSAGSAGAGAGAGAGALGVDGSDETAGVGVVVSAVDTTIDANCTPA
jgi:hypothetical protein